MSNMSQGSKNKLGKGGIIAIVLCGVVIAALLIVIIVLLSNDDKKEVTAGPVYPRREVVVTEDNVNEVIEQDKQEEEMLQEGPLYYAAEMNMTWKFPDGKSASSNAYVANSTDNEYPVYFDVLLGEDEEVIYSSPVIPVGSRVEKFKLDKELAAGTYEVVVSYMMVDEDQKPLRNVRVGAEIIIEN